MSCACAQICLGRLRNDSRVCAPRDAYFTVARVQYVNDGDGGVDRDDEFLPERYPTLEAAMDAVRGMSDVHTYVVDDHPRIGMFPAWRGRGGPDAKADSECELAGAIAK